MADLDDPRDRFPAAGAGRPGLAARAAAGAGLFVLIVLVAWFATDRQRAVWRSPPGVVLVVEGTHYDAAEIEGVLGRPLPFESAAQARAAVACVVDADLMRRIASPPPACLGLSGPTAEESVLAYEREHARWFVVDDGIEQLLLPPVAAAPR